MISRVFHAHRPSSWTSSHASVAVGPCAVPTGQKSPRKLSRRSRTWTYGQTSPWGQREARGIYTGICTKKGHRRESMTFFRGDSHDSMKPYIALTDKTRKKMMETNF